MADTLAAKLREGKEIMVKQIVRDVFFLGQKSEPATKDDLQVGRDLQDTLHANRDRCVGMAADIHSQHYAETGSIVTMFFRSRKHQDI